MSIAIASTAPATANGSYAENVGRAARSFLAALLAVKPEQAHKAAPSNAKAKYDSLYALYRLAGSYDSVMPNLAQELRAIASRQQ
jgi:hypothetical protein